MCGAAAEGCTLINCTVVTNIGQADGIDGCNLKNCISYYNFPDNGESSGDGTSFSNCCVVVTPTFNSANNFTNPPAFANLAGGDFHLSPASPCINAGNNSFVTVSNDLDDNPRIVYGTVDLGAYESPYNNLKTHYVSLTSTNPVSPFNDWSIAATNIQDAIDAATNGDLVLVTNGVYQHGGRKINGYSLTNRVAVTKPVTVQSVNGSSATRIEGSGSILFSGSLAVRCVYLTNGAALIGFTLTNGTTLNSGNATYELSGVGLLCESIKAVASNCVVVSCSAGYGGGAIGGTLNNCTILHNSASFGGGVCGSNNAFSSIGSIPNLLNNCIVVSNYATSHGGGAFGSTLNGCLISSNSTGLYTGGGAAYSILNNCIITNNAAPEYNGGGVSYSTLTNCLLVGNRAFSDGGGAYFSTLNNCTVASNSASISSGSGGGTYSCGLSNSIVYYNSAHINSNYISSTLSYCDTTPSASGFGNITNDPVFVNLAGGDFHLQSNSPCINSGNNAYVTVTNDLDGNPRIVGGTVDIGAYEYQTPSSIISYAYLQQYGLPTDGSADYLDSDGDGMNNWQEWKAGTNPTNAASVLQLAAPSNSVSGVTVTWQSVGSVTYYLQSSTNLAAQPAFTSIQSNIVGQAGSTSYTDTTATNGGPYFYRVGLQ